MCICVYVKVHLEKNKKKKSYRFHPSMQNTSHHIGELLGICLWEATAAHYVILQTDGMAGNGAVGQAHSLLAEGLWLGLARAAVVSVDSGLYQGSIDRKLITTWRYKLCILQTPGVLKKPSMDLHTRWGKKTYEKDTETSTKAVVYMCSFFIIWGPTRWLDPQDEVFNSVSLLVPLSDGWSSASSFGSFRHLPPNCWDLHSLSTVLFRCSAVGNMRVGWWRLKAIWCCKCCRWWWQGFPCVCWISRAV